MSPKTKPTTAQPNSRKLRVNLTLDPATLARLREIQEAHPDLDSISATVRYLSRQTPKQENER